MATSSDDDPRRQEIEEELSSIFHDINSPLSVIVGNTQLLMELSQALNVDEEFGDPLEDVEAAAERIELQLARLKALCDGEFDGAEE